MYSERSEGSARREENMVSQVGELTLEFANVVFNLTDQEDFKSV